MAFPQRISSVAQAFTNSVNHQVTMPVTVTAGQLLRVWIVCSGDCTITTPSGWTAGATTQFDSRYAWFEKVAVGNEDGTSVNFVTSASAAAVAITTLIDDWYGDIADGIAYASFVEDSSTNPNPPLITAPWGVADNLFMPAMGVSNDETISAAPANYTNLTWDDINSTDDLAAAVAFRELAAASDDPGTFTMDEEEWGATGSVVRPGAGGTPATVTPNTVAIAATVPSPTATGAAVRTPATVPATITVPQPGILAGALVTPNTVPATTAVPQPTVDVAPFATPDPVAIAAAVPQPSITAAAVVTPLTVAAVAALPQPTITISAGATPDTVAITADVPTPMITAAALVEPATVAAAATVPQATASVPGVVTPAVVAILTAIPQPTLTFGATVSPAVVAINVAVPTPSIFAGVLDILANAFGQFRRLGQRLHLTQIHRGVSRGFRLGENWERVSDVFVYDETAGARGDHEATMLAVADVWAAHAGSDAATLKAAIHTALDSLGYRKPNGDRLV